MSQAAINELWVNRNCKQFVPPRKGVPTLITWNFGGNEIAVQGSWDGWSSRRALHKSGKDHTILLVLPSGVYYYNFIIDGDHKHIPDLPCISDERGRTWNILDVKETVPEILESVKEFEAPPSPISSYSNPYPDEDDFAKDPPMLPPQLHTTSLGAANSEEERPQHVMLDHLFIEEGWAPRQVLALGLTHRYRAKYVTVVLYKPLPKK